MSQQDTLQLCDKKQQATPRFDSKSSKDSTDTDIPKYMYEYKETIHTSEKGGKSEIRLVKHIESGEEYAMKVYRNSEEN